MRRRVFVAVVPSTASSGWDRFESRAAGGRREQLRRRDLRSGSLELCKQRAKARSPCGRCNTAHVNKLREQAPRYCCCACFGAARNIIAMATQIMRWSLIFGRIYVAASMLVAALAPSIREIAMLTFLVSLVPVLVFVIKKFVFPCGIVGRGGIVEIRCSLAPPWSGPHT